MPPIDIEICINSPNASAVRQAVEAAYIGGASRVELCSAMDVGGLTPEESHVLIAREAFVDRRGLLVMIRPRGGDFFYTSDEVRLMLDQIAMASRCGVDGVVFGALRREDQRIDVAVLRELVAASLGLGLATTFHRAFDATPDSLEAVETLVTAGVDRILTCGMPWGNDGTALDGRDQLAKIIAQADGRIEIVIGGGVNISNIAAIREAMGPDAKRVSVHAYSGAQHEGVTTADAVEAFVRAVRN